jgi:creatinine amidohydrolase
MAGAWSQRAAESKAIAALADHQSDRGATGRCARRPGRPGDGRAAGDGTARRGDAEDTSTRSGMTTPQRLKDLAPDRITAAIAADPRLIVPVGTCDPHGPHLPIGCDTLIVDRLADDLSAEFGILRAPTVEYGVSADAARGHPRGASVRKKTLHLLLNDLLASWEHAGVREFILLTANGDDAHREALATVMTAAARVRVVDACAANVTGLIAGADGWLRGGEADTSLMLYLAPHLVDMRLAEQYTPDTGNRRPGPWGWPRAHRDAHHTVAPDGATAERGQSLYDHIRARIAQRIAPSPASPG